ncbi:hypothetical protein [Pseudoduganella armeniaca]|uniref:Uncharacterized protein n=1 Tax=Pseudoduganella armeniaca TaxID=2072590 RepID=A0A2R4CAD1_9BURK|nr:hypothetical protein [Pseudoduganella armeniaca]AVR96545.1 hypothetical protein C9I28_13200 [Pseudoduganella armeniaca]
MNVVRNAEAVFVATVVLAVVVAAAAPFLGLTRPGHKAPHAQPHRVSQLVTVPSVPVVIVRAKRPSAEEKAQAATDKPLL